jgi:hypothetical protein
MAMQNCLDAFSEIWLVDFEFSALPGERPDIICMVAREVRSGRTIRLWQDDLEVRRASPFQTGANALMVAYLADAEFGCSLALRWDLPANILDLYREFKNRTDGLTPPNGFGLLGTSSWYGLDVMDATEKESMRALAMRGGPRTESERAASLDYCKSDVLALARLLPAMEPESDLSLAVACRGQDGAHRRAHQYRDPFPISVGMGRSSQQPYPVARLPVWSVRGLDVQGGTPGRRTGSLRNSVANVGEWNTRLGRRLLPRGHEGLPGSGLIERASGLALPIAPPGLGCRLR